MKRASGFYWVNYCGDWLIAEYLADSSYWWVVGSEEVFDDSDFDQIDERRIVRQPEVSE